MTPILYAEIKTYSPAGFKSEHSREELIELALSVGDRISVLVDPLWNGLMEHLIEIRKRTKKVILAKGRNSTDDDIKRAVEVGGADEVLVVGRDPGVYPERCIIEPYTLEELKRIPKEFGVVWNSRDLEALLKGFAPRSRPNFDEARAVRPYGFMIQASNLNTIHDVNPRASAVLVGSNLPTFAKSLLLTPALSREA